MAEPGSGWESDALARSQPIEPSVEPNVRRTLDHVDELVLGALGVGVGRPPSGRQPLMVDPGRRQAEVTAERRPDAKQFVDARIVEVIRSLDVGPVSDAGWTVGHFSLSRRLSRPFQALLTRLAKTFLAPPGR